MDLWSFGTNGFPLKVYNFIFWIKIPINSNVSEGGLQLESSTYNWKDYLYYPITKRLMIREYRYFSKIVEFRIIQLLATLLLIESTEFFRPTKQL